MSIVEKIQHLCIERGNTLVGLERELGIGRGIIRRWDKSSPSSENLKKVADYFNVTTDYLLGRDTVATTIAAHRTDGYCDDLPPEAQEELKNYIDYLKVKYKKNKK